MRYFSALVRRQFGIFQQGQRQRLDAGLAGDLCLGAALLLVGQVEVFQALFGFGVLDLGLQFRRQLALFLDAGQDGGAALFQFAQVAEALFQRAQLRVVQAAGDFLAVAGDEGHGGAFVEQGDGGVDLGRADVEFNGNAVFDGSEHGRGNAAKMGVNYAQSGPKIQPPAVGVGWPQKQFQSKEDKGMKVETICSAPWKSVRESHQFPNGLVGFEQNKRFMLAHEDGTAQPSSYTLQSLDDPNLAFQIVDPVTLGFSTSST